MISPNIAASQIYNAAIEIVNAEIIWLFTAYLAENILAFAENSDHILRKRRGE
jgi:hypothetical protein